jgi:hypothetical protein
LRITARADIYCAANKAGPGNIDRGRDCPKNNVRRPSGDRVETRMECRTGLGDCPEVAINWTVAASASSAARAGFAAADPDRDRSPAKTGFRKRQKNPVPEMSYRNSDILSEPLITVNLRFLQRIKITSQPLP